MPPTDAEIGKMLVLNGLDYDRDEIGERVGYSAGTVGKYINAVEDEAEASSNPFRVFAEFYTAHVFDNDFRSSVAALMEP